MLGRRVGPGVLFSTPAFRWDPPPPVPAALVQSAQASAGPGNRPLFKAPPLEVQPPMADIQSFTADLPKLGRAER
ncbi:MAG TPA: hypothetical protein VHC86_14230 [Opitutaceae bacterium]|nr:hypothetical protein [Opitutaceae bacterium]